MSSSGEVRRPDVAERDDARGLVRREAVLGAAVDTRVGESAAASAAVHIGSGSRNPHIEGFELSCAG